MSTNRLRIGILGASGYTGAELVRLLARHPAADIAVLSADRKAGKTMAEVFPHLAGIGLPVGAVGTTSGRPLGAPSPAALPDLLGLRHDAWRLRTLLQGEL